MKTTFVNLIHTAIRQISGLSWRALDIILPRSCAGCGTAGEIFCEKCASVAYQKGTQCLICGFRNNDGKICGGCFKKAGLETNAKLRQVWWAGPYDGALREAIWQLKYKKRKELAAPLAKLLWKKFCEVESPQSAANFERHGYFSAEKFLVLAPPRSQGLSKLLPLETKQQQSRALRVAIIPIPLHFKKEYERGFNQAELLAQEFGKLSNIQCLTNALVKTRETKAQVEVENKELRIANLENAFEMNHSTTQSFNYSTIILIDDVSTTGATLFHASSALGKVGVKKIIGLVLAHGG